LLINNMALSRHFLFQNRTYFYKKFTKNTNKKVLIFLFNY